MSKYAVGNNWFINYSAFSIFSFLFHIFALSLDSALLRHSLYNSPFILVVLIKLQELSISSSILAISLPLSEIGKAIISHVKSWAFNGHQLLLWLCDPHAIFPVDLCQVLATHLIGLCYSLPFSVYKNIFYCKALLNTNLSSLVFQNTPNKSYLLAEMCVMHL